MGLVSCDPPDKEVAWEGARPSAPGRREPKLGPQNPLLPPATLTSQGTQYPRQDSLPPSPTACPVNAPEGRGAGEALLANRARTFGNPHKQARATSQLATKGPSQA